MKNYIAAALTAAAASATITSDLEFAFREHVAKYSLSFDTLEEY